MFFGVYRRRTEPSALMRRIGFKTYRLQSPHSYNLLMLRIKIVIENHPAAALFPIMGAV